MHHTGYCDETVNMLGLISDLDVPRTTIVVSFSKLLAALCMTLRTDLVSAPTRISDDIDDGTPAAGALVLTVVVVRAVVVVFRSHLHARRPRHVEQNCATETCKRNCARQPIELESSFYEFRIGQIVKTANNYYKFSIS